VPKKQTGAVLGHTTMYMTEKYTHIENEVSDNMIDLVANRLDFNQSESQ
jgi:hypothetical protein